VDACVKQGEYVDSAEVAQRFGLSDLQGLCVGWSIRGPATPKEGVEVGSGERRLPAPSGGRFFEAVRGRAGNAVTP
jgi:hypothetical protein